MWWIYAILSALFASLTAIFASRTKLIVLLICKRPVIGSDGRNSLLPIVPYPFSKSALQLVKAVDLAIQATNLYIRNYSNGIIIPIKNWCYLNNTKIFRRSFTK